ncbi:NADPH:quinone oxidoreductase, partial [Mucuna pruriens]
MFAAIVNAAYDEFGRGRAQYIFAKLVYLDLHFINKPEFFLNAFQPPRKFNDGDLIDEEAKNELKKVLLSLQEFTLSLQGKPTQCWTHLGLDPVAFLARFKKSFYSLNKMKNQCLNSLYEDNRSITIMLQFE